MNPVTGHLVARVVATGRTHRSGVYPIGLQLHMALRETGGGEAFIGNYYKWLANSSLIHETPDENGDAGGIIDWLDDVHSTKANWWERFIDTSAFVVFNEKDFRF